MANENAIRLLLQGILCSSLFPPEAADSINRRWKVTCNGGQNQSLFRKRKRNSSLRLCFMYSNLKVFFEALEKKFNPCLREREERLCISVED